jgi:excisionase family DNA binding protein
MNNFEPNENKSDFQQIIEMLNLIQSILEEIAGKNDCINKEKWMDNADMCALLGITKRTLQRYRQKGVLPYYMMRGKPYYKKDEVQECLKRIFKGK